ncbi:MAG: PQQ-binding-like beta-propeller repeat protein, partial [Candidatus Deferrimicrobiaceae bacterium]
PLIVGNRLFVTASYGVGAVMAEFDGNSARKIWANDNVLSSQYSTSIHHDGFLYGVDGRADVGVASLCCVDLKTGQVMWTERNFGVATIIMADGKLLIMKTDGQLLLASVSLKGFRKLDEAQLFDGTVRALPALADGRFYARDEQHLKCFHVGR